MRYSHSIVVYSGQFERENIQRVRKKISRGFDIKPTVAPRIKSNLEISFEFMFSNILEKHSEPDSFRSHITFGKKIKNNCPSFQRGSGL